MIHLSPWQSAPWPERVDCIITDPPYSERTHAGHAIAAEALPGRADLGYGHITTADAEQWGEEWARRVRYWLVVMCDHVLWPHWESGAKAAGLYTFPPVFAGITAMTVRVAADGPASWGVWMMVARTARPMRDDFGRINGQGKRVAGWGSLPGLYVASRDPGYTGGKPLPLMQQIIRDYSREGMLVADPCAGHGSTLVAAKGAGRRVWGAECDPAAHAAAVARLNATPEPMLMGAAPKQEILL